MNITLNLYTNKQIEPEEINQAILDKNPLILVATDTRTDDVVSKVEDTGYDMQKAVCFLRYYDTLRTVAFLASFKEVERRKVLIMAPKQDSSKAIKFAQDTSNYIKQVDKALIKVCK